MPPKGKGKTPSKANVSDEFPRPAAAWTDGMRDPKDPPLWAEQGAAAYLQNLKEMPLEWQELVQNHEILDKEIPRDVQDAPVKQPLMWGKAVVMDSPDTIGESFTYRERTWGNNLRGLFLAVTGIAPPEPCGTKCCGNILNATCLVVDPAHRDLTLESGKKWLSTINLRKQCSFWFHTRCLECG